MHPIHQVRSRHRTGMTWVEVLVVLGATTILVAVIAPAVLHQRKPARTLECLNNMRNVGLAIQNYSSGTGGTLPPLDSPVNTGAAEEKKTTILFGWPIMLLPALDCTSVLKNIKRNAVAGQTPDAMMTIADSEKIWLPFFTCPQDSDSFRKAGGLSFVVNAGFIARSLYHGDPDGLHRVGLLSWDGNSVADEDDDIRIGAATGAFWRKTESFQPSLDYISDGDGTSHTLMLTENLQAGNWFDTDTARISFGLPIASVDGQVSFGAGAFFESVERPLNTEFAGGTLSTAAPQDWRINSDRDAKKGTRPRPSSNHKNGVNVIMCDGSGRFLSDNIDPHVYVKLLTSRAVEFGEGKLQEGAF